MSALSPRKFLKKLNAKSSGGGNGSGSGSGNGDDVSKHIRRRKNTLHVMQKSALTVSRAPRPTLEGFLEKRGEKGQGVLGMQGGWKRRYFRLDPSDDKWYYYDATCAEDATTDTLKGHVNLSEARVVVDVDDADARVFRVETPGRLWELRVPTKATVEAQEERKNWTQQLSALFDAIMREATNKALFGDAVASSHDEHIVAGTLDALVESLLSPEATKLFEDTFFLTMRSFVAPSELMSEIARQWKSAPPPRAATVAARLCTFLQRWITETYDFAVDANAAALCKEARALLKSVTKRAPSCSERTAALAAALDKQALQSEHANYDKIARLAPYFALQKKLAALSEGGVSPPDALAEDAAPQADANADNNGKDSKQSNSTKSSDKLAAALSPRALSRLSARASSAHAFSESVSLAASQLPLCSLNVTELTRQLTLIDFELFHSILPIELFGQAWREGPEKAPNVCALTTRFNRVAEWVSGAIVSVEDEHARVATLDYFLSLLQCALRLNNFHLAAAVAAGLQSSAIVRLKKTWAHIDTASVDAYNEALATLSHVGSFRRLRSTLHAAKPPALPLLAFLQADLTFIDDGNRDLIQCDEEAASEVPVVLINFRKRTQQASVLRYVQRFQRTPYFFRELKQLQAWVESEIECFQLGEDKIFELSILREPRYT